MCVGVGGIGEKFSSTEGYNGAEKDKIIHIQDILERYRRERKHISEKEREGERERERDKGKRVGKR